MFADAYEKARAVGEVQRPPVCPADYFAFLSAAGAQPEPKRIRPESPVMGSLRRMLKVADRAYLSIPAPEFLRTQLRRLRYKRQGCPVYFFTKAQVEDLAKKAGGKITRIEPLGRRSGFWIEVMSAS